MVLIEGTKDAGITYRDKRYRFGVCSEFMAFKDGEFWKMNPLDAIPLAELNAKLLAQSYAILRLFNRLLGNKYDGDTQKETYWVDAMYDVAIDWRTVFVDVLFSRHHDQDYPAYEPNKRIEFLKSRNDQLKCYQISSPGPYVLGDNCTYADFVNYQVCHDTRGRIIEMC